MIFKLWQNKKAKETEAPNMSAQDMQRFEEYCTAFKADEIFATVKDKNLSFVDAAHLLLASAMKELSELSGNFPALFNPSQGNDTSLSVKDGVSEPKNILEALQSFIKLGSSADEAQAKALAQYPHLFKNPYKKEA